MYAERPFGGFPRSIRNAGAHRTTFSEFSKTTKKMNKKISARACSSRAEHPTHNRAVVRSTRTRPTCAEYTSSDIQELLGNLPKQLFSVMKLDNSILLWTHLQNIAKRVCAEFGLHFHRLEALENRRLVKWFGETIVCDKCIKRLILSSVLKNSQKNRTTKRRKKEQDIDPAKCRRKTIRIRLHQYNSYKKPLAVKTIIDTLAHELAHLKADCWKHGRQHTEFQKQILDYIVELGYTW